MNFFKKAPKEVPFSPSSIPFSVDHPEMQNLVCFSPESLIRGESSVEITETLRSWLMNHQDLWQYLNFYWYKYHQISSFAIFKRFAIKSQFKTAYEVIKNFEKSSVYKKKQKNVKYQHPFPQIVELKESKDHWYKMLVNLSLIDSLRTKIEKMVCKYFAMCKEQLIECASLLCSTSFSPAMLPVINFNKFEQNQEIIEQSIPQCVSYSKQIMLLERKTNQISRRLSEIAFMFATFDQSLIEQSFISCAQSFSCFYRKELFSMNPRVDVSPFYDFIRNPLSSNIFVQAFFSQPSPESFFSLVYGLGQAFNLEAFIDTSFFIALMSSALLTDLCPPLIFNGPGFENDDSFFESLNLIVNHDPISILSSLINPHKNVDETIILFIHFSNDIGSLFKFVLNYTEQLALPRLLGEARDAISDFLNKKNDQMSI